MVESGSIHSQHHFYTKVVLCDQQFDHPNVIILHSCKVVSLDILIIFTICLDVPIPLLISWLLWWDLFGAWHKLPFMWLFVQELMISLKKKNYANDKVSLNECMCNLILNTNFFHLEKFVYKIINIWMKIGFCENNLKSQSCFCNFWNLKRFCEKLKNLKDVSLNNSIFNTEPSKFNYCRNRVKLHRVFK